MFSRYLRLGATALMLTSPLAFASGAQAHSVHAERWHARAWYAADWHLREYRCHDRYAYYRHLGEYRVMVRDRVTGPWCVYRWYDDLADAQRYAAELRCDGYSTQVVCP